MYHYYMDAKNLHIPATLWSPNLFPDTSREVSVVFTLTAQYTSNRPSGPSPQSTSPSDVRLLFSLNIVPVGYHMYSYKIQTRYINSVMLQQAEIGRILPYWDHAK